MCAREGIGVVAVIGGIYMLVYLVKNILLTMNKNLGDLTVTFTGFMSHVRKEHEAQMKHSEALLEQNKEVTDILKSINNRTEKCNK